MKKCLLVIGAGSIVFLILAIYLLGSIPNLKRNEKENNLNRLKIQKKLDIARNNNVPLNNKQFIKYIDEILVSSNDTVLSAVEAFQTAALALLWVSAIQTIAIIRIIMILYRKKHSTENTT